MKNHGSTKFDAACKLIIVFSVPFYTFSNQYVDPLAPIFKAIDSPILETRLSDTDDDFFNTVNLFEERMMQKKRNDGLGSSRVPRYQTDHVPRRKFELIEPVDKAVSELIVSNEQTIVFFQTEYKGLYFQLNRMWTSIGDVEIRTMIRSQDNQEEVRIGSWVTVRIE